MLITKTVQINASPELIWEMLTDLKQIKRWNTTVISDEPLSPGPPHVGQISKMMLKEGSKAVEYESEISHYQPTSQLSMILRGGNLGKGPMYLDYQLSANETGTMMNYESKWEPHGFTLKLMAPIINKMAQKNATEVLNQLKVVTEQEVKSRQVVK